MIRVTRGDIPESLEKNGRRWTEELLQKIAFYGDYRDVPDTYKTRYRRHEDIKQKLDEMYNGKCCYCESGIGVGVTSYGRVEHLRPKSRFYNLTYDWCNLHWCCEICNTEKSDQWDSEYPILDPTVDEVEMHLVFNPYTYEVVARNDSQRAKTTIDHTSLNRPGLKKARELVLNRVLQSLHECKYDQDDIQIKLRKIMMIDKDDPMEYSAFIRMVLQTFLR